MALLIKGVSSMQVEVGIGASQPMHTVIKPLPQDHYRVARRLVPAATTTAGVLWELQNPTGSGKIIIVKRVFLRAVQVGAPTAAIEDIFTLKVARSFTTIDSTGSVAISPAAAMQKMRTSMNNAAGVVRESNAAGGATAGTKTLDTDAVATGSLWVMAALSAAGGAAVPVLDYYPNVSDGEHPVALAASEGIVLSNTNSFGTASGIVLHVELYWAEVTVY